jgi:hypothetical protein
MSIGPSDTTSYLQRNLVGQATIWQHGGDTAGEKDDATPPDAIAPSSIGG